jgi:hypothetical protein
MLIDRCYHHGRYDDIDYRAAPTPPLKPDEESWAHELLVRLGLRSVSPSEDWSSDMMNSTPARR